MDNADEIAGAPVVAGVKVLGSGSSRRMIGGVVGALIGKGPGDSPLDPRQLGFLAATADRLLLLNFRHGLLRPKATGLLGQVPRALVASVEIKRSLAMNPIAVVFTDGTVWNFEVDKMNVGKAKRLGAEFAGANEV